MCIRDRYASGVEEGPEAYWDDGSQKTIFVKLNSSGVIQWQKEFRYIDTSRAQPGATGGGAPANTNGSITGVGKPAIDSSGNMYCTGLTRRGRGNGNMRIPHFFKIDSFRSLHCQGRQKSKSRTSNQQLLEEFHFTSHENAHRNG